jgi:hypothetical protein
MHNVKCNTMLDKVLKTFKCTFSFFVIVIISKASEKVGFGLGHSSTGALLPFSQLRNSDFFLADIDATPKNFPRRLLSKLEEGIEYFKCPYPGCKYVATLWDLTSKVSAEEYHRRQKERHIGLGEGSQESARLPGIYRRFGRHYLLKHDFPYASSIHEIEPYYPFCQVVNGIESVYCPRCPFSVPMKEAKDYEDTNVTRNIEIDRAGTKLCEHYVDHLYKDGKSVKPNPLAIMPLVDDKEISDDLSSFDWGSLFHEGKDVFICPFKSCNFSETTGIPTTREADGGYSKASVVALVRLAKHYMLTHDFPRFKNMTPEEILQARLCVVEQTVCSGDIGADKFSMMCPRCGFALPVLEAPTEQLYFQFWNHYWTHLYSEDGIRLKPKAECEM